ncbi:putative glycosyl transferase, family 14 [Helianthus annuus]|uniref:Glycosyl transferase, family 14 n=1 Tax=Helianthus annuus TaxID=4232 RepID=A0A251TB52_HELAN|nr:glycosyltransferase BC10 [Helianthus annuus]KAF5777351.1 putative glycosyl transferase, family 14 [Helianthus annuus]KAJ0492525.1 putative glycosyl transferase, family 14 [Helianthus annuus]KAJ0862162.1 putative glycosyl transferase, family 14 [Helianthus annuus]
MKNNHNTIASSPYKLFNPPLQPSNLLSLILFFAFGLSFGILLTFQLKNVSFNFRFNDFATTTTTTTTTTIMGLQDFMYPSKTTHNMTDQELIWRASMVPKVRKYPYERIPKVAFMFLTRGPVLMSPLWEMFFQGYNGLFTIYVHMSNSSSNWTVPEDSVFHDRKIPSQEVQWGKVNMIEAERRLLANALLDFSNQRFVLLSESCIPLFNFTTIYSYLINSNQNFVESYDLMSPVGRGRYNRRMYPTIKLHDWRKGSQWFEMDRDLALEVISDATYFPVFQMYCNGSCYADEHYLPTLITKKFGSRNSGRTLTFVDWSKGGPHPARYTRNDVTIQFLEKLRSTNYCEYNGRKNQTCHLFARKFTPHALDRLLRLAPRVMQFNP